MDEEVPLVENIDDEEAVAGYVESFDQPIDGGNDHASIEDQIIDLQGDENTNGLVVQASNDSDDLEQNLGDEPNFDDRQLLIYQEGSPDYPIVQPGDENRIVDRGGNGNIDEINVIPINNREQERHRVDLPRLHENVIIENIEGENVEGNSDDESDNEAEDVQEDGVITYSSSSEGDVSDGQDDEEGVQGESFDTELPAQHRYMGESREVAGRIILEEDLYVEIPIIAQPGIILMPGQTLPMTLFQPSVISMMKRLVETTKTFGVLHKRYRSSQPGLIEEASVGTTAEIYEYREPPPSSLEAGYHIKAKGRQRFKIISIRRQVDGNRIATVDILREKVLPDPLYETRLITRDRLRPFSPDPELKEPSSEIVFADEVPGDNNQDDTQDGASGTSNISSQEPSTSGIKGSLANLLHRLTSSNAEKKMRERENKEEFLPKPVSHKFSKRNHLRTTIYAPPLSRFPNWVYEMYDPLCLVERIHEALSCFRLFSQTEVAIPQNPEELSFWVATNLPLDDTHRMALLKLDCTIQRLRCELSLLERSHILCCRNCGETLAQNSDIFSMSREGPQGAYVNPGGYVHETLTLYKVKNVLYTGQPSTEYSWFPGYAWQICQCSYCDSHLGWRFTASSSKKLHPKKFYGISRRSIRPKLEMEDSQHKDNEDSEVRPVM